MCSKDSNKTHGARDCYDEKTVNVTSTARQQPIKDRSWKGLNQVSGKENKDRDCIWVYETVFLSF